MFVESWIWHTAVEQQQVCVQLSAAADNVALPAFACHMLCSTLLWHLVAALIDWYFLPTGPTAANKLCLHLYLTQDFVWDWDIPVYELAYWDRRMDRLVYATLCWKAIQLSTEVRVVSFWILLHALPDCCHISWTLWSVQASSSVCFCSQTWNVYERSPVTHTHTHTRLTALCLGLPGWADTRKVKPIWILLKQQTVSGSRIRWAICKSAPRSRQITMPVPHRSVFYRPDALPAAQPTASKHWRQKRSPVKQSLTLAGWKCNRPCFVCVCICSFLGCIAVCIIRCGLLLQSNLPKWVQLKWMTHLNGYNLSGPI